MDISAIPLFSFTNKFLFEEFSLHCNLYCLSAYLGYHHRVRRYGLRCYAAYCLHFAYLRAVGGIEAYVLRLVETRKAYYAVARGNHI